MRPGEQAAFIMLRASVENRDVDAAEFLVDLDDDELRSTVVELAAVGAWLVRLLPDHEALIRRWAAIA